MSAPPAYVPPADWLAAVDAMRWEEAGTLCPPTTLPGFKGYVRGALRGGSDLDPWKVACAVAGRKEFPSLTVGIGAIPTLGLDEPDPRLRAWAVVRQLLHVAPMLHAEGQCSRWLQRLVEGDSVADALRAVGADALAGSTEMRNAAIDGVNTVAWWLTGVTRESIDYFWVSSARNAAAALEPFQLLSSASTQARLERLKAWAPIQETYENRKGDLVFFLRRATSRTIDDALHLIVISNDAEFAWQSYQTLHRLSRQRLRDDPDSRLGSWCSRAIAAGTLGARIACLPAASRLIPLLETIDHQLLSEAEEARWEIVPVFDGLVAFPLWRALRVLLRNRIQAGDIQGVERVCRVIVRTDSLSAYSAKYAAQAVHMIVRCRLGTTEWRTEQGRQIAIGLLVAHARRKSDGRQDTLERTRKRLAKAFAAPQPALAEEASLAAEQALSMLGCEAEWVFDPASPDVPEDWTDARCESVLRASECSQGDAPSSVAGAIHRLRRRLTSLRAAAEDRVVDDLLWPAATADWFADDTPSRTVPHNLPPTGTEPYLRCREAVRSYVARCLSPLPVPEVWTSCDQFPHLYEDLRHLVGAKSCAQGEGSYNISLGNLVLLLAIALARGACAGRPIPKTWNALASAIRWTRANRRLALVPVQSSETSRRMIRALVTGVFGKRVYRDHADEHGSVVDEVRFDDDGVRVMLDFSCTTPTGGERSWLEKLAVGDDPGWTEFQRLLAVEEDAQGDRRALSPQCVVRLIPVDEQRRTMIEFLPLGHRRSVREVATESMTPPIVVFVDTDAPRRAKNASAARSVSGTVLLHTGVRIEHASRPGIPVGCPPAVDLVLVHERDRDLLASVPEPKRIVRYTGGAPPEDPASTWVSRAVTAEQPILAEEVAALLAPAGQPTAAGKLSADDRALLALFLQAATLTTPSREAWLPTLASVLEDIDGNGIPAPIRGMVDGLAAGHSVHAAQCVDALASLKPG